MEGSAKLYFGRRRARPLARQSAHRVAAQPPPGFWSLATRRASLNTRCGGIAIESIELPRRFVDSDLFRTWSGDSQKLYFWLRARCGREDPLAPESYQQLLADDYLATFATAELLMERAIDCSRNTLTKLIRELVERRVAQVPATRPGYVFILGERERSRWQPAIFSSDVFYLDRLVAAAPPPVPTSPPADHPPDRAD